MRVTALFATAALAQGDHVKSQQSFTEYYGGYGFFGGLTTLTTNEMYAVRVTTSSLISVSGTPTQLPKTVQLSAGWTWLPCPYSASVSLADGLPTYEYVQQDHVKSQQTFAEFYVGYGWFGTLTELDPGAGYKLRVTSTGGITTFPSQRG